MKSRLKGSIWIACLLAGGVGLWVACGSEDKTVDDTSTGGDTIAFTDIKTILDDHCAGSGCHADNGDYVSSESKFKASASLTSIKTGTMPKSEKLDGFTAAEKAKLIAFLEQ